MSERTVAGSSRNRYTEGAAEKRRELRHPMQLRLPSLLLATALSLQTAKTVCADASAEIRAVLEAQVDAWNRGDIDGYMNGYARGEETEFVSGDTVTRGWQTVRDRYAKKYDSPEKMGTLSFSDVAITTIGGDAAFVTGRWELSRKGEKPHGRFTLLFRQTPDGWRIVHDHTSAAP